MLLFCHKKRNVTLLCLLCNCKTAVALPTKKPAVHVEQPGDGRQRQMPEKKSGIFQVCGSGAVAGAFNAFRCPFAAATLQTLFCSRRVWSVWLR